MARRRCCGLVDDMPQFRRFVPEGASGSLTVLQVEELEAMRLKDVEGLEQADCAAAMGLSRPTFQRILRSARLKAVSALVEGKTLEIRGGYFMVKNRVFECIDCSHTWEAAPCSEGGKHGYEIACPKCGSFKKLKHMEDGAKHACGGGHHHHGGHHGHGGCCGH